MFWSGRGFLAGLPNIDTTVEAMGGLWLRALEGGRRDDGLTG